MTSKEKNLAERMNGYIFFLKGYMVNKKNENSYFEKYELTLLVQN